MPEQGDIVLIPVPFTDWSSQKRRPVIIISNDVHIGGGADIVVVAMTSRTAVAPYSFQITSADLVEGALNRPGTARVDKVYTLAKTIIVKKFGKVSPAVIDQIRRLLEDLTEPTS
jgi:mRNA interferase MazF